MIQPAPKDPPETVEDRLALVWSRLFGGHYPAKSEESRDSETENTPVGGDTDSNLRRKFDAT